MRTAFIGPDPGRAFIYRVEGGMDDRDLDEVEAMDSGYVLGEDWPTIVSESVDIGHRMRYLRRRGLGLHFLHTSEPGYGEMLAQCDPDLPAALAWITAEFYLNGTVRLSDLLDNIDSANPLGLDRPRARGTYRRMVVWYLSSAATEAGIEVDGEFSSRCTLARVPVGRCGSAEVWKEGLSDYRMRLVPRFSVEIPPERSPPVPEEVYRPEIRTHPHP